MNILGVYICEIQSNDVLKLDFIARGLLLVS